jgi:hypothetical protein
MGEIQEGSAVPQGRQDAGGAGQGASLPTAAGFDQGFAAIAASPGIRRVWETVDPDLPPEIEPFSFVSMGLLGHVADALALAPGRPWLMWDVGAAVRGCGWRGRGAPP